MKHRLTLTARQTEVLRLKSVGLSDKEVAARLFLSTRTVAFHLHCVYARLGVRNCIQALIEAHRLGLIERRFAA